MYYQMRFLIIVLFSFSSLLMSGCWFDQENERESITRGLSPKELYNLAEYELKSGNTEEAFNIYENVLAAYPASKYSSQAKLRIIYENYKAEKYDDAILATENYISENPNDSSTPYAYYMRALISEKLAKSILDDLVTDFAQRDITSIISAFNYYLLLIEKFPDTSYADDAKKRLVKLRNAIARHELFVAIFYTKKQVHIAAINRCKYIIETYPETPSVPAAIHLMAENYKLIGQIDLANDARRVLRSSYPNYIPHYSLKD